jgi:hypothetical protein
MALHEVSLSIGVLRVIVWRQKLRTDFDAQWIQENLERDPARCGPSTHTQTCLTQNVIEMIRNPSRQPSAKPWEKSLLEAGCYRKAFRQKFEMTGTDVNAKWGHRRNISGTYLSGIASGYRFAKRKCDIQSGRPWGKKHFQIFWKISDSRSSAATTSTSWMWTAWHMK